MMLLIFLWLLTAGLAAYVASEHGRGWAAWFLVGLLAGPFALVAVIVEHRRAELETWRRHTKEKHDRIDASRAARIRAEIERRKGTTLSDERRLKAKRGQ